MLNSWHQGRASSSLTGMVSQGSFLPCSCHLHAPVSGTRLPLLSPSYLSYRFNYHLDIDDSWVCIPDLEGSSELLDHTPSRFAAALLMA